MHASTIREMLKVTQRPNIISFAGGLPAAELFPTRELGECAVAVMNELGGAALQYSVTEGVPELRDWIAQHLVERFGGELTREDVLTVNGSQQGLDLIGKILIDPGDHVAVASPTYLGAIQAFDAYQARYLCVEIDEDGMIPESLQAVFESADPLPKFLYTVPNFQNPTGRTLAAERRSRILAICARFDVPVVEDDPYSELQFDGVRVPPLLAHESDATVIYVGTASKIAAPGLRVAWVVTRHRDILEKLVLAKQGADLHTGTLSQYVFLHYVSNARAFEEHVAKIRVVYRDRRDAMLAALAQHMPASVEYNTPRGGMFLWCRVPGVDTEELLAKASEENVVFVPGVSFYPNRDHHDGMRLNFSSSGEEKIALGIERLAHAVRSLLRPARVS